MRVERRCVVDTDRDTVWKIVSDPENYSSFMTRLERWDSANDQPLGVGARYLVHWKIGSVPVGGLIEVERFDPQPVPGQDQPPGTVLDDREGEQPRDRRGSDGGGALRQGGAGERNAGKAARPDGAGAECGDGRGAHDRDDAGRGAAGRPDNGR